MNVFKSPVYAEDLAELFRLLGQPARLQILLVIGEEEACVCHMEAVLGLRQAYISQQLMILRDAGLVTTTRDGRNIFYRLTNPNILTIIQAAGQIFAAGAYFEALHITNPVPGCPCPHCAEAAGVDPAAARQISCDTKPPLKPGGTPE